MQNTPFPRAAAELDLGLSDLGPLAWVLEELRKSLDTANKALRRFVRDAEAARGSDLGALDSSQLRIARGHLHQAVGALEMVGLGAPAVVLAAMEGVTQKFIQRPELCSADAATVVERASFALTEYLENVLAGRPVSSVQLFAQYRDVQDLAAAERIHPADLWTHEWRWREVAIAPEHLAASAPPETPASRALMDPLLLRVMKNLDPVAAQQLGSFALQLRNAASQNKNVRTFWALAAAYFEAIGQRKLPTDMFVKRAASRVLLQFTALDKGDPEISERLVHDLLFFCAQAGEDADTPLLRAVRHAYGLTGYKAVDYDTTTFGKFDPALLQQARKRVQAVKESWSQVAGGDTNKIKSVVDQFSLVSESLTRLHPPSEPLAQALSHTMDALQRANKAPSTEVSMEVATSALYLEAVFEDLDPSDASLAQRTTRLAQRLQSVRNGGRQEPLEPWMEELYRRVSDKQTMGSVVDELRVNLGEIEQSLDQFFRNPVEKARLQRVPAQLAQMRGVLSVLGLDQASTAMLRMRGTIEALLTGGEINSTLLAEKLGNSLGALGFLIDMLGYQPVLAKKLFVYDDALGELRPVMGRTLEAATPEAPSASPEPTEFADSLSQALSSLAQPAKAAGEAAVPPRPFDGQATVVMAAQQPAAVSAALSAPAAPMAQDTFGITQLMPARVATEVPAMTTAAPAVVADAAPVGGAAASAAQAIDDELLGIFLEEAREVVQTGQAALQNLALTPGDVSEQTTLRRAFHTLKGSSRMVGLNEFGEAAWSMEQVMNSWMAEARPVGSELQTLSAQTLAAFGRWAEDIGIKNDGHWSASPFHASAQALRADNRLLPLALGVPAAVAITTTAAAALAQTGPVPVTTDLVVPAPAAPEAATVTVAAGGAQGSIDLPKIPAGLTAPAGVTASPIRAQPPGPMADIAGIDFASLAPIAGAASAFGTAGAFAATALLPALPEPAATPTAPSDDEFSFDLNLDLDAAATSSVASPLPFEPPAQATHVQQSPAPVPSDSAAASLGVLAGADAEFDDVFLREVAALEAAMETRQSALEEAYPPHEPTEFAATAAAWLDEPGYEKTVTAPHFAATVTADYHEQQDDSLGHPHTEFAATVSADFDRQPPPAAPELASLALNDFDFIGNKPAAALTLPVAAANAQFDNRDQVKVIGPLRIGIALYNVYLNEADEWSRRLQNDLGEWALEFHQPLGDTPIALAHSLAGSSATVGFSALSELARALEMAQLHVQTLGRGSAAHAQAFCAAADAIRTLLHQFAAGFLKKADAQLIAQLKAIETADDAPTSVSSETPHDSLLPVASALPSARNTDLSVPTPFAASVTQAGASHSQSWADFAPEPQAPAFAADAAPVQQLGSPSSPPELASPAPDVDVAAPSEAGALQAASARVDFEPEPVVQQTAAPAPSAQTLAALEAAALAAALPVAASATPDFEASRYEASRFDSLQFESSRYQASRFDTLQGIGAVADQEDEIDVQDAVDADLFPIFEEEAVELLPQLGAVMRQWSARPDNLSARTEVLRALHTLKGSARLAGALRLGEMAHRMESAIEYLPSEDVLREDIEPLVVRFDAMHTTFEALRQSDAQEYAQAMATSAALAEQERLAAAQAAADALAAADAQAATAATAGAAAMPAVTETNAPASAAASATAHATTAAPGTPRAALQVSAAALLVTPLRSAASQTVRVRSQLLDRMVNQAGEVMITRSRLEAEVGQLRSSLNDLTGNLERLRLQLRDIEVQAESQMQSRLAQAKDEAGFDPLEFDRFTRVQELTRMMAESVNDVATVHRNLQRTIESTEGDLIAQARQTRDLQRDLLRTRMVEFEGISERLYRVVRQASKDAGKQVKLDIVGGAIEMDRGVLDRMTPAFEHLLRNCVAHGIESAEQRKAAGKDETGAIVIALHHEGNDVSVEFRDDGAGLNIARIRERAMAQGLLTHEQTLDEAGAADLIFTPGFSTASKVTELSGRGIGMDVVRSEINAVGGRVETRSNSGQGTTFKLVLPLTTAVTQVVMLRSGNQNIGVPANVVELVRRATAKELQNAYNTGFIEFAGESVPFFWCGALLQSSSRSNQHQGKTIPVVMMRSAGQRVALHVDEVLGSQEVVVKNLGPQLARLPGLAGMSVLASGAVVLIYNPVALAAIYGEQARLISADHAEPQVLEGATDAQGKVSVPQLAAPQAVALAPLVLVVDDSITVRRVTQRLLQREGYRVAMAADGLQAIERLADERPAVVLSDIEMPRMDGFDLARNIRGDVRLASLPIVMITSRIAEKHREYAMELGVNHYLGKPYSEEELLSLVRRYTAAEAVA